MRILAILLAILLLLFGLRLVLIAAQTAWSSKILVRHGIRSRWQSAPTRNEAWKMALRDGVLGLLLMVLGIVMIF